MKIALLRKIFNKIISLNPVLERSVRYRNPREYWEERGGTRYFLEQEGAYNRTLRSEFIANEINNTIRYHSVLEIGCGYGKQLQGFVSKAALVVGCDFSRSQLLQAKKFYRAPCLHLVEADGSELPFKDKSFDLVFSSAVILHNDFEKAKKIISEMIRVSRKYLVHNEDTDVTFSRYGYDLKKTYEKMNFKIVKSIPIPCAPDPAITQFTIVELEPSLKVEPSAVVLAYH